MKKTVRLRVITMFMATIATSALSTSSFAGSTNYPYTLDNCGLELNFKKAPQKSVTIGQSATEILYSLGLQDQIQGTSVWFTEVLPEFKQINKKVHRISDNGPSFEGVIQLQPEIIAVEYEWYVGAKGTVGTREQFQELGINTYILPADCVSNAPKDKRFSTDSVYQGVTELATIFDVKDRGVSLVKSLKAKEKKIIKEIENLNADDLSAVFWFSSTKMGVDPYVAGKQSASHYIMSKLNVENIVTANEDWPTVGWETIAKANPTFIVVAKMTRRRREGDDYKKKIEFLKNDPVTKEMDAVKNNRIIVMDGHTMDPSIRAINGIEILANAIKEYQLHE